MLISRHVIKTLGALALLAATAGAAFAAQPLPWQLGFQPAVTPIAERVAAFNDLLVPLIVAIATFVLILLLVVMVKFRRSANPNPSKSTHNSLLEVVWTVIPIIILIVIAVPSFRLLYFIDKVPDDVGLTVKVVGHQWYWTYEYQDHKFSFDANLNEKAKPRLLETDNRVVLPVNTTVRVLLTADDVIHAWTVPAFGMKFDTIPGRLAETWVNVRKEGVYYGQCSELCGARHSKMPIAVEVVSKEKFTAWVAEAKKKFATGPDTTPAIATAAASD
jgi:cytochrome c oxidase subunit 2